MNYSLFKLHFKGPVHFGDGFLNQSVDTFHADTLFSALYIEAIKLGLEHKLYEFSEQGKLLFSNAFPYKGDMYFIPKPLLYIEPSDKDKGNSSIKKKIKKLKFIQFNKINSYMSGNYDLNDDPLGKFCCFEENTKVCIRNSNKEEAEPYPLGNCYFHKNCGLYVIVAYDNKEVLSLISSLMDSLQYSGIGGKRSIGCGRFECSQDTTNTKFFDLMDNNKALYYMALSSVYCEENLNEILSDSYYLLEKRSGFIASNIFAEEQRRKDDSFFFSAGSCFKNKFNGTILNVSGNQGSHPVYRYAKGLFIGL